MRAHGESIKDNTDQSHWESIEIITPSTYDINLQIVTIFKSNLAHDSISEHNISIINHISFVVFYVHK